MRTWATREEMYEDLPKRVVGVELGVCRGENAEMLYEIAQPDMLYLVDQYFSKFKPWSTEETVDGRCKQRRIRRIAEERMRGKRVKWLVDSSHKVATAFPKSSIDWIYIDASHQFPFVLSDIKLWYPKVKSGGVMMFHDYTTKVSFGGVARAIQYAMTTTHRLTIAGVSEEKIPSVMLRKL